jgi:hypothetical protein
MCPCEFCGAPGFLIEVVGPFHPAQWIAELDDVTAAMPQRTRHNVCLQHKWIVEQRAMRLADEEWFARHEHGRPTLDQPSDYQRSRDRLMEALQGSEIPDHIADRLRHLFGDRP